MTNTVERYLLTGSVEDRPRSGRLSILQQERVEFIDERMSENDELTTRDLAKLIRLQFPNLKVSNATIVCQRLNLGWTKTAPRYCQLIRNVNMEKRLEWTKDQVDKKEQFDNVIFSDESSVQIEHHSRRCYHKKGQPRKLKPKPKHSLKVHVWAGISKGGATKVVIFDGKLIATKYTKILEQSLLSFIKESYPKSHRFFRDNDPKHTSRYAQNFFVDCGINWWRSPPESPDLNPIENVWGSMKTYLRDRVKPSNQEELVEGIKEFWKTMTPDVCTRYINHIQRVMPVFIEKEGATSGF